MEQKRIAVLLDSQVRNDGRVRRVVESLSESYFVDLYCASTDFDDSSLFSKNVSVLHYNLNQSWWKRNIRMDLRFNNLLQVFRKNNKSYDFIYSNDYPLLRTAVKLKKEVGAKLIYDSHEIYIETINQFFPIKGKKSIYGKPLTFINQLLHSRIESKFIKEVDQLITVCDSFKKFFEHKWGVKSTLVVKNCPKNIKVTQNPNLLRGKLKISNSDKIILYQGDVNISRGIDTLAEAMPFIDEKFHFVILGSGPKLEEFKRKYASSNIHFFGKVPFEELYEYTTSCDIGIMLIERYNLSKELTLPNKVFEYMVASKPFITNTLPEASKIANEEKCGFVIDDSSPQSIAKAINEILVMDDLTEMGKRGRKAVEEKYNWEKEVKKLIKYVEAN